MKICSKESKKISKTYKNLKERDLSINLKKKSRKKTSSASELLTYDIHNILQHLYKTYNIYEIRKKKQHKLELK